VTRARSLRAAQCREGWHLEDEPIHRPAPPDDWQTLAAGKRADFQQLRDRAEADGCDTSELDELLAELAKKGMRGNPDPGKKGAQLK
jgi:hypothetical protein